MLVYGEDEEIVQKVDPSSGVVDVQTRLRLDSRFPGPRRWEATKAGRVDTGLACERWTVSSLRA